MENNTKNSFAMGIIIGVLAVALTISIFFLYDLRKAVLHDEDNLAAIMEVQSADHGTLQQIVNFINQSIKYNQK